MNDSERSTARIVRTLLRVSPAALGGAVVGIAFEPAMIQLGVPSGLPVIAGLVVGTVQAVIRL